MWFARPSLLILCFVDIVTLCSLCRACDVPCTFQAGLCVLNLSPTSGSSVLVHCWRHDYVCLITVCSMALMLGSTHLVLGTTESWAVCDVRPLSYWCTAPCNLDKLSDYCLVQFFYNKGNSPDGHLTTHLQVSKLGGCTITIITAHAPGQHIWASSDPGPDAKKMK